MPRAYTAPATASRHGGQPRSSSDASTAGAAATAAPPRCGQAPPGQEPRQTVSRSSRAMRTRPSALGRPPSPATVTSTAPTRPNHATNGTISATIAASRTRFRPNSERASRRAARSTASTATPRQEHGRATDDEDRNAAAYRSVNRSDDEGWAATTRSTTIGGRTGARAARVLSCHTATAAPSRPAPRCSLIRTIITLSTRGRQRPRRAGSAGSRPRRWRTWPDRTDTRRRTGES